MTATPRRLRVRARRWARRPGLEQPMLTLEGAWLRDEHDLAPGDVVEIAPRRGGGLTLRKVERGE